MEKIKGNTMNKIEFPLKKILPMWSRSIGVYPRKLKAKIESRILKEKLKLQLLIWLASRSKNHF